jgi:hypothetical protein
MVRVGDFRPGESVVDAAVNRRNLVVLIDVASWPARPGGVDRRGQLAGEAWWC